MSALITKHLRERRKLALLIFVKAVVERSLRIREARQRGAHNAEYLSALPHSLPASIRSRRSFATARNAAS